MWSMVQSMDSPEWLIHRSHFFLSMRYVPAVCSAFTISRAASGE